MSLMETKSQDYASGIGILRNRLAVFLFWSFGVSWEAKENLNSNLVIAAFFKGLLNCQICFFFLNYGLYFEENYLFTQLFRLSR